MLSNMRLTITKHYSCGRSRTRIPAARTILYAAAFGSLSSSSAFLPHLPAVVNPLKHGSKAAMMHPLKHGPAQRVAHHQHSRPFFSLKDDSDWGTFKRSGGNLLKRGTGKIKSLIPFGKSDKENRASIMKKERKDEISGGINTLLKDAPFPIRMIGKMVSPILAQAADQMAKQSMQAQEVLEEARIRMANDPALAEQLGEPLQVGQPFSQSSSTMVINGNSQARVQASFQVAGPRGSGVATVESSNGEITLLTVNANGRNISVGSSRGESTLGKSFGKTNDDIIDAEIIEK